MTAPSEAAAGPTAPRSIEERLTRLEAMEAARNLVPRYPVACDATDVEALATLFTEDAVLEVPGTAYVGRDEVIRFYREAFALESVTKSHFITNMRATWLGNGHVGIESYFLYTAVGDSTSEIGWGVYGDEIAVRGEEALFCRKSIAIRGTFDVGKS
jgi:SnoaL-like domain